MERELSLYVTKIPNKNQEKYTSADTHYSLQRVSNSSTNWSLIIQRIKADIMIQVAMKVSFLFTTRTCLLYTIMKGDLGLKKKYAETSLIHHCFAWKSCTDLSCKAVFEGSISFILNYPKYPRHFPYPPIVSFVPFL